MSLTGMLLQADQHFKIQQQNLAITLSLKCCLNYICTVSQAMLDMDWELFSLWKINLGNDWNKSVSEV